ncbi:MAG TPA: Hsp20 family protein [Burkholderiaceae bacterium]|nr:Hsp20 family protein [Burkholderiaceae bacterium]
MMVKIEKSVEVNVPLHTAYNQMTQFEQFPRFMEGVQEVRQLDDTHLHWHSKHDGQEHEWDSEITEQAPDKYIAWRNTSGQANTGRVDFEALGKGKTKIVLKMECEPAGTGTQAREAEKVIAQRTEQDLARFKKMIEAQGQESGAWRGEVRHGQTVAGQPEEESKSIAQPAAVQRGEQQDQIGGQKTESWVPKISEVWEEPFVVMRKMSQEMDNFFERFIGRPLGMPQWAQGGARHWSPPIEVARRGNQVVICADLPGIKREDVHVEIRNDRVTIEGDRHAEIQRPEQEYRRTERPYGHFYREVALPEDVDPESAAASMHDGVLEITLPVAPISQRRRRIEIRSKS